MTNWIALPHGLLAWAATYLLHSTLLLGAAWAVSRALAGRSLRLEERLWKAALVGAIVTATIQTGVASLPAVPAAAPALGSADAAPAVAPAPAGIHGPAAASAVSEPIARSVTGAAATPDPRLSRLAALLPGWQRSALGAWAFGALLLVSSLAVRWARLRVRLRRRRDVEAGAPRRLLDRLLETTASRRRVRLTGSSALPVPVALGVGEQEICLPRRALRELDDRRQEGLLAHELAHLERRDPAWLLLALGIESVLFFQPLNRLARRRLEEIAELQCDAWAVRATGDRVGLARCLTDVAGWLLEDRRTLTSASAPGAAAMARSRGQLGVRVRRILAHGPGDDLAAGRRWLPTVAAAALLAVALVVPGLAPSSLAAPAAEPQVAPGAEGVPASDEEREAQLRSHHAADSGLHDPAERHGDHDEDHGDRDHEDWDHDWDFDHDFRPEIDSEEIAHAMAQAVAAARAGMLDDEELADLEVEIGLAVAEAMKALDSMPEIMAAQREALAEVERELPEILAAAEREMAAEGRELSPEERERMQVEIERELAEAHEEMERALEELEHIGPELEELRSMQHEIGAEVREEMRRARDEARDEHREALREAERDLAEAQREIEEARRELDRERAELERERQELERERAEELSEEPPGA